MRKIIALILISLIVLSCSNELKFNTPAFQGLKNYDSWIADSFQASLSDDGALKIIGIRNRESVTVFLESADSGIYNLESSVINSVDFEDNSSVLYSTLNNGDGEIVIEDFDTENLTVTGTFKFNAYSINGEVVNFIKGVFDQIPIVGAGDSNGGSDSFNATVNSNDIEFSTIETDIIGHILHVKATNDDDGTYMEIFLPENISVGNHTLNFSTQTFANYVDSDGSVASSQFGTLTILEYDQQFNKIKGTFLFNTGNPYNIIVTGGNFLVYY